MTDQNDFFSPPKAKGGIARAFSGNPTAWLPRKNGWSENFVVGILISLLAQFSACQQDNSVALWAESLEPLQVLITVPIVLRKKANSL